MGSQEPGEEISSNRSDDVEDLALSQDVKVVDWEDFHDAFVHMGGVAVNLAKVRARKEALVERLQAAIEKGTNSLKRVDALEAMKRRLREKQEILDSAKISLKEMGHQLVETREKLLPSAQALLHSTKTLASAQGRLQEADKLLNGEGGYGRLIQLRKLLDARRRQMVGQVASLYPLATCTSPGPSTTQKQSLTTDPNSQPSGASNHATTGSPGTDSSISGSGHGDVASNSVEETSIAIAGLQLLVPAKKQPGLFNEKNDYETSATALGYVAHVVSLTAAYLDVPLRYPVRVGASRSYIQDYCPAAEPAIIDTGAFVVPSSSPKPAVEFPLFSDGQEVTRSAYAVFLLNKDLEQVLNRFGIDSVGPRHTLPNLNRLINTVTTGIQPLA